MNRTRCEFISVAHFMELICRSTKLLPYVTWNDKTPSWDGDVILHENDDLSKRKIGRVPVQIKGHEVKDLTKEAVSYQVDICDLHNYYRDQGVIYIIVLLKEKLDGFFEKQCYYCSLDYYELKKQIKKGEGQKSITLEFKKFPQSVDLIEELFLNFHDAIHSQSNIRNVEVLPSITELIEANGGTFNFSVMVRPGESILDKATSSEIYLYTDTPNGKLPFKEGKCKLVITETEENVVSVDKRVFYTNIKREHSEGKNIVLIGDSFRLSYDGSSISFSYHQTNSLRQRVVDTEFLLAVQETGHFSINKCEIKLSVTHSNDIDRIKKSLSFLEKAVKLLDVLNIKEDINLDNIQKKDLDWIKTLYCCIVEKKTYKTTKLLPVIVTAQIQSIVILLTTQQEAVIDNVFQYRLNDFFSGDIKFSYVDNDKRHMASPFWAMTSEWYATISNIDWNRFIPSFSELIESDSSAYSMANNDALNVLIAYDKTKKVILLQKVIELFEFMEQDERCNLPKVQIIINKYQAIARLRNLNLDERIIIRKERDDDDDYMTKFCLSVLLNDDEGAGYYLSQLNDDDKDLIMQWPIFTLWNLKKTE